MITIKQVNKEEILQLRHDVLRENKPLDSACFNEDDRLGTIHIGYFDDNNVAVGCVTMIVTADDSFDIMPQYRLRGMAVDAKHQGKQIGTALIKMAEFTALNNNVGCLWLNARLSAKDFYQKQGFNVVGDPFKIKDIGTHFKMVKYPEEHHCNCSITSDKNNTTQSCNGNCSACKSNGNCSQQ